MAKIPLLINTASRSPRRPPSHPLFSFFLFLFLFEHRIPRTMESKNSSQNGSLCKGDGLGPNNSGSSSLIFLGTGCSSAVPNARCLIQPSDPPCQVCSQSLSIPPERNPNYRLDLPIFPLCFRLLDVCFLLDFDGWICFHGLSFDRL